MAFKKEHTDAFQETYAQSYWRVVEVNINKADRRGRVLFYGYPDEARKGGRIVGDKAYPVSEDQYDTYFGPDELNPEGKNPYAAAYELAMDTKDVSVPAEEEGQEPTYVSFFEHALAV